MGNPLEFTITIMDTCTANLSLEDPLVLLCAVRCIWLRRFSGRRGHADLCVYCATLNVEFTSHDMSVRRKHLTFHVLSHGFDLAAEGTPPQ